MKRITLLSALFAMFALACSEEKDSSKVMEKLKKEQASITQEIDKKNIELTAINAKIDSVQNVMLAKNPDLVNANAKPIATSIINTEEFKTYIEVQGKIDARQSVDISPQTMGTVIRINVKEGDKVSAGQTLAELDNRAMREGLEEIKVALSLATTLYEKQKSLWDQNIGTEIQFLQAKNNKESLERRLASTKEQVNMSYIRAPFSGSVDEVMLRLGQNAAPGMPAVRVVNLSTVRVVAELAESYINRVKIGDEVEVLFKDLNKTIKGKVAFASKSINTINRTFKVEVTLNESLAQVSPNMIAILKINDAVTPEAVLVPVGLIQGLEKQYIMVAEKKDNTLIARRRDITIGRMFAGKAEILSGLKAGDRIITAGYQDLGDEQIVIESTPGK